MNLDLDQNVAMNIQIKKISNNWALIIVFVIAEFLKTEYFFT